MTDYRCPLEKGKFYHIYNRGNVCTNLFYKKENYEFFLHLYSEYLWPYIDTFALCLLPNHFHLLVQIKDDGVATRSDTFQKGDATSDLQGFKNLEGLLTQNIKTIQI